MPSAAELSNRARQSATTGSAAGTGTTTADMPVSDGTEPEWRSS